MMFCGTIALDDDIFFACVERLVMDLANAQVKFVHGNFIVPAEDFDQFVHNNTFLLAIFGYSGCVECLRGLPYRTIILPFG